MTGARMVIVMLRIMVILKLITVVGAWLVCEKAMPSAGRLNYLMARLSLL